jgi:hypothetical protein
VVPRLAATVALLFAATTVFAQEAKTVKIEFEGEGKREVWIQEKGKLQELPERTASSGKAITIEVPSDTKDRVVLVRDFDTNNVATRALDQVVKAGAWTVGGADYTHAFVVAFWLRHEGRSVQTALVKMGDRQKLVSVEDEGVAAFNVVPFGDVEVTVEYRSGGEDRTLAAQTFEVKAGMGGDPAFDIEIADEVTTIAESQPTGSAEVGDQEKPESKEEEAPRTNWFATLLNMVIGLAVIGGIAYAVWRYVKANPDETADAFKKAGVAMPGADPGDPAQTPKKTGPPQQIILTDADPTPADTSFVATAAPAVKNPRLVKADGSVYIVMDGEQAVGREEGSGHALAGESSVSRTHAKLTRAGDAVTIEDAGSTNGTFVNGQRLSGPQALSHGDSVQFGAVQVRYEE